jgi:hypothetical protein
MKIIDAIVEHYGHFMEKDQVLDFLESDGVSYFELVKLDALVVGVHTLNELYFQMALDAHVRSEFTRWPLHFQFAWADILSREFSLDMFDFLDTIRGEA